ncbi:MAG: DUF2231 domain-containing protein [Streptosporangiaceae bacterium]
MTPGLRHAKRPVSALLAGPYGHPYHPMLVTVPIGAWLISLGFDIASHISARPGFLARGSEWLIAIGVIGAIVAGSVGLLDLAVIPAGTRAFRTACTHMIINLTLIVAYGVDFGLRYRSYGDGSPVSDRMIALSVACVVALAVSGYLGGKLTYRYGVRVASETSQADGYLSTGKRAVPEAARGTRARRSHRA